MSDRKKDAGIFRETSLKRVSSPEDLDQYIKSTTPTLWLLLAAVIVLLVGIIVWGACGKIDSTSVVGCRADAGLITAYIREAEYEKLCEDSYVEIQGECYPIEKVTGPSIVSDRSDAFLVQAAGIEEDAWYYTLTCSADLEDGEYKGAVVYEQVSPITFIIN